MNEQWQILQGPPRGQFANIEMKFDKKHHHQINIQLPNSLIN